MARPRFYQRRHSLPKGHNPVRAALAVDAQRKLILDLGVLVALADEGSEQRELIANLACVIAVGAEIAVHVNRHHPLARRLHGTLRTLTDMAQNGCRWRKACALVIAEDLETSHQLTQDFPQIGLAAAPACQALARDILNDRLHPDAIAGAEIYRETEGTTA